jgi:predicted dehydrogenase
MMKTENVIKWGMIGCGDVTEKKSGPAFNKVQNSRLVAVMCRTPGRVEDYVSRHGISRWYTNEKKLIADSEINAIYIATPPDSHAYYTELAAASGRPVYVEKPMARTHKECQHMIEVCEKAGVPLFVAYYRRCLPKSLRVKELLDSGVIGDVRAVSIMLLLPPRPEDLNPENLPWRVLPEIAGGGYFIDLASHQFDLLDYLLGPISEASGITARQTGWYPAEDIVSAHFRFENGILGNGLWCFSVKKSHSMDLTEIIGSDGKISFSFYGTAPIELKTNIDSNKIESFTPEHVQQPLIEKVVRAILENEDCPSTGITAARTNFVMDSILNKKNLLYSSEKKF